MSLETMTKLFTTTVGAGGSASITFSNIPQGYTDLKILSSYRTGNAQTYDQLRLTFNGSSTGVYSFIGITGNGSGTPGSEISSSTTSIKVAPGVGNSSTASVFSNDEIYIANYTSNNYKSLLSEGTSEINATAGWISMFVGLWSNPSPITSITLTPESSGAFSQHSTFVLYGIKNARQTVGNSIKATGGNIAFDGTYVYHVFPTTGAFVTTQPLTIDYLVVAGGGSGGSNASGFNGGGGGGGAGGLRLITNTSVASGFSYTATVGAGGAAVSPANQVNGNNGTASSFGGGSISTSATGGGGGGAGTSGGAAGNSGGSGGGAGGSLSGVVSGASGNAGGYSPVEGYNGGSSLGNDPNITAGGGGGSGGVGGNAVSGSPYNAGAGGIGSTDVNVLVFGKIASAFGTFAGGGGGGTYAGSNNALGAAGGGNGFGGSVGATSARPNTGSGGGGDGGSRLGSGAGGSGIVIIRYKG